MLKKLFIALSLITASSICFADATVNITNSSAAYVSFQYNGTMYCAKPNSNLEVNNFKRSTTVSLRIGSQSCGQYDISYGSLAYVVDPGNNKVTTALATGSNTSSQSVPTINYKVNNTGVGQINGTQNTTIGGADRGGPSQSTDNLIITVS